MLIFPLKKEWFEKIKRGEKTVEYREVKPYWKTRLWHAGCLPTNEPWDYAEIQKIAMTFPVECVLRCGYDNANGSLTALISRVEIVDGKDTDLAIDKPVYAIHLKDIKECEE